MVLNLFFEGSWSWVQISKEEYEKLKANRTIPNNDIKINKKGQFKKHWSYATKFHSSSYGFRPGRSTHGALQAIKNWKKTLFGFLITMFEKRLTMLIEDVYEIFFYLT